MVAYAHARDAAVPPAVAAAWDHVLEAWDEQGRHDALLRLVAEHDAYVWAAGKYRDAKRSQPASPSPFRTYPDHAIDAIDAIDAIADRQLDRMRRAAEATLYASATARERRRPSPYRAGVGVIIMFVIAIAAGALFMSIARPKAGGGAAPAEAQPAAPLLSPAPPASPAAPRRN
jgi:hypothetical protein